MEHPAPFGLKYIGLGNEQWGDEYIERLQWFSSSSVRYDGYDRKGPKVFVGEYACHG